MKYLLLLKLFVISSLSIIHSQTYNINIHIDNLNDTSIFLGYHYGEKNYILDTIILDNNGNGIFTGTDYLNCGLYFIAFPSFNYFDFLIDSDQNFTIETDTSDFLNTLKFFESEINNQYINYQKEVFLLRNKSDFIKYLLGNYQSNKDSVDKYNPIYNDINNAISAKKQDYILRNKNSLLGSMLLALQFPEIPASIPVNFNSDSLKNNYLAYYFKNHFFDNYNFSDECLLGTTILPGKLNYYFTTVVDSQTDSLNYYVLQVIEKSKVNSKVNKYVISYLLTFFEISGKLPNDEVFVEIAEKYYLSGQNNFQSDEFLKKLSLRVDVIKPLLLGKLTPELILESSEGNKINISDISSDYIVLYFWDIECGHCYIYTPVIYNIYKKLQKQNIQFVSIYTEFNKESWLKYIDDHQLDGWINAYDPTGSQNITLRYDLYKTPRVFILNKNKEIIAKDIEIEDIENVFNKLTEKKY